MSEVFIKRLLHHRSPNAVLIVDNCHDIISSSCSSKKVGLFVRDNNASFHHSEHTREIYLDAGVMLLYLPPYSPDLSLVEEFFAELKVFSKKQWHEYENSPYQDFGI